MPKRAPWGWAGQGAATACLLKRGAQCTMPCPHPPRASQGLMYPQNRGRGSGATEQTAGSALGLMARDEFTP